MAKHLVQIIVLGTQAVGRAFAMAVRQEYQASQAAAAARKNVSCQGQGGDCRNDVESIRLGISLEEARQILNVNLEATPVEIQKQYDHLFKINDRSRGGSLYIQSKLFRAKERLDKISAEPL